MQALVLLMVGAFVIGGTPLGRWVRERPPILFGDATVAAASYYSLAVVL